METEALVAVGEVLRPWGLQGEVRVKPLTDRPKERFRDLSECVLWEPKPDRREPCREVHFDLAGVLRLPDAESKHPWLLRRRDIWFPRDAELVHVIANALNIGGSPGDGYRTLETRFTSLDGGARFGAGRSERE